MRIKYSKQALKFLAKQERKIVNRILAGIDGLTVKPPKGDIKPMQGMEKGSFRLRIGSYRIVFWYDADGEIEILYVDKIDNRGDVYK